MRCVLAILVAAVALAQPSAVLDDLEGRALRALSGIPRAESWPAVLKNRDTVRRQFEQAIGLEAVPGGRAITASVYTPRDASALAPGIILLRAHTDRSDPEAGLLPTALAQLGMFVVDLDASADHARLDLLGAGVTPQSLMQQAVRSALTYFKANSAVDPERLALVSEGLAGTVAAAINEDISAAVLLSGAPDFVSMIKELRALAPNAVPDPCVLMSAILEYAASQELLSLIAPRPLLLMNADEAPLRYATELYRMAGAATQLYEGAEKSWTATAQYTAYTWLARHLEPRLDLTHFVPPAEADVPSVLELTPLDPARHSEERASISEQRLSELLGVPLPEGRFSHALNCHSGPAVFDLSSNRLHYYPQSGIRMPVTVLRPGPTGCDGSRGTLIAVSDAGRSALVNDEIVLEANRRGWIVWMLDPRYVGEMAVPSLSFPSVLSLLLGEHIPWRQATDILRTLRNVGGFGSRYPTAIYARGRLMGLAASYVAAIADQRELEWTLLRDSASSFGETADSPLALRRFEAVRSFDVLDLWKIARGKVHLIHEPEEFLQAEW